MFCLIALYKEFSLLVWSESFTLHSHSFLCDFMRQLYTSSSKFSYLTCISFIHGTIAYATVDWLGTFQFETFPSVSLSFLPKTRAVKLLFQSKCKVKGLSMGGISLVKDNPHSPDLTLMQCISSLYIHSLTLRGTLQCANFPHKTVY